MNCRQTALLVILVSMLVPTGLLFAAAPRAAAASGVPDRITQTIDDSQLVTLRGNTRPEANATNDRGLVPDGFSIEHMSLLLQRSAEQEQELESLIDSLNDKDSPNFHHWLTPEDFGERFGVSQDDIDTVTRWLESHGFLINKVHPNHVLIDFSGTAGQLREAFHTELHNLEVNGESHLSNTSDPQIPLALAPVVKGVVSLNDFKPHAMNIPKTDYTFVSGSSTYYAVTAQDNAVIYNVNPLWNAGYSGQGQTIYIAEDSDAYTPTGGTFASDWNTYRSTFGLSGYAGTLTQVHPGGCTDPGGIAGTEGEVAIDMEVSSSIAPSAAIELITCKDPTLGFGGLTAMQNLFNTSGVAPGAVSLSYGECEAISGAGLNAAFYSAYQQAASEGFSVFVSTGDDGPTSCAANYSNTGYDVANLGITGWGETPYNVSVGGTDFEDVYNEVEGGAPLSTYWSATNSSNYGSALEYVPEIPWNDSCASVLLSEALTGSFTPYGASPATCNNASYDTTSTYLSIGAGSGGASNCATGAGGASQTSYGISSPECQGYPKPSWQSGSTLTGGQAVFGVPSDGVRDIPDVSMFAANGVWSHYEVVCFSNTSRSAGGASCAGAPSTWAGYGGTSVASPSMAAIQALVNQKSGQAWGNPDPIYYQIAQNEYGTASGSFLGGTCNASAAGGPANSCAFHDVTQGDIDLACENNGTVEEAHCYLPAGTHGVVSTDVITAAAVINGGTGYTSAPTCTIAGPSNNSPYLAPTGATLYAGGTQATCTASVSTSSSSAVWSILISNKNASGQKLVFTNNSGTVLGTYTLSGTSTTAIATALAASINSGSFATATASGTTVTATAITAGYTGNFYVTWGNGWSGGDGNVQLTQTTAGQGPNYVSGITVTAGGSGYQPETPITLTGSGSGAIAVANTSPGTAASSYQPAYGAAPGYDLATGLGTPNAYNLVCSSAWGSSCPQSQTITFTTNAPASAAYGSSFTVAATATSGLTVAFTSSGACTNSGSTYTITSGSGTCSVIANQSGNSSYTAAPTVTETTTATQAASSIAVSSVSPASEDYGSTAAVTVTAQLSWAGSGSAPTAGDVSIGGSGLSGSFGMTSCGAPSGDAMTCTNTYTPSGTDAPGSYTMTAAFSGDSNYSASISSQTNNFTINDASSTTVVTSSANPSTYGQSVTLTATITGEFNFVKGKPAKKGARKPDVGGTVTWSANTGCGTTAVTSGNPGVATCTTSSLATGTDAITATYSGDSNHGGSTGTLSGGQVVNQAASTIAVTGVSPASEDYGSTAPVTITAQLSWTGSGSAPTASDVSIGGSGLSGSFGGTSCGAPSGTTITCTNTYSPGGADVAGNYTMTGAFAGDTNYSASTSSQSNNFTINAATTTTSVSSTPNPSTYAQQVTFTATITAENGPVGRNGKRSARKPDVGGTVAWSTNTGCGTTNVTGGTSGNPGVATCTTSAATHLPVGTDAVTATYSGDSNHSGSAGSVNQVVQGGIATTIDVTNVSPSNEDYGADSPVTITAVLSWTGHGTAPTASDVTISGNGNGTYGSTSCAARVNETITCTATYTPSNADGAGTYTETAAFSGDVNYATSSSPETNNFTINAASSTTVVGSSANPSTYGQSVTFTATITAENGPVGRNGKRSARKPDVTGTVAWSANTGCGTTNVTGGTSGNPGVATCTTSSLNAGSYTIIATYSGDANHGGSSGTLNQTVNPATATVTLSNLSQTYTGSALSPTVTTTPAGLSTSLTGAPDTNAGSYPVTATITNSNYTGSASGTFVIAPAAATVTLSKLTQTYTGSALSPTVTTTPAGLSTSLTGAPDTNAGSYPVTATITNSNYTAAPASGTFVINKAPQTITFTTPAPSNAGYNSSFTVAATASSGLAVTYTSSGACSNSGATYTMTAPTGTCTVTAGQSGNSNYVAANNVNESTFAMKGTQIVTFTGAPATAYYLSSFNVATTQNSGITPTITASPAATCSVSGTTVTMKSGTGTCNLTAKWAANTDYLAATAYQTTTAEKVTPTLTWTTPAAISYGTALSGTQLDAMPSVSGGTFTYTPASGAILTVGTQTLSVTYKATPTTGYNQATASVQLVVNPVATVTTITSADASIKLNKAGSASTTVRYNVTSYKPTGSVMLTATTGETCTGTVASGTGNGSCILTFTTTGTRTINASYSGDANHTASNNSGQTPAITVTVAPY